MLHSGSDLDRINVKIPAEPKYYRSLFGLCYPATKKKLLIRKTGIQLNVWHKVFDSRLFEVPKALECETQAPRNIRYETVKADK